MGGQFSAGSLGELAPNLGIQIVKSDEFNQKGERPGAYHTVIGNRVTYVQADPPAGPVRNCFQTAALKTV